MHASTIDESREKGNLLKESHGVDRPFSCFEFEQMNLDRKGSY